MGLLNKMMSALGIYMPDADVLKNEQAAATVAGLRSIISGHPEEGLNPVRLAQILKGAELGDVIAAHQLAESMEEKYLHYRSVLSTRKLAVSSLPITVTAASADPRDVRAADLVREVMEGPCVRASLFDMLDACGKGYSVSEIMWDLQTNEWRPDRIVWRRPEWFVPDRVDGTRILLRGGPGEGTTSLMGDPAELLRGNFGTPLEPGKYVVHTHKSKSGTPVRGALSRPAAWAYMFQNFTVKSWAVFLEVYGHPLRVGKYDNSASPEQKKILLRAVRDISMDAAAIIPTTMSIDFIDAPSGTGGATHQANLDWWNNQVSKLVLGQTGTSDTAAYQGTADAHEHVRDDLKDDDAAQLSATLQRDIAAPITQWNVAGAKTPHIFLGEPETVDVTALVGNVKTFVAMGGQVSEAWLAGKMGIPTPEPTDVLLKVSAPIMSPFGGQGDPEGEDPEGGDLSANAQLPQRAAPVNDALDTLQAQQLADWKPLANALIDPVQELLEACSSIEEFQARLPEVLAKQKPEQLAQTLAQTNFAARLAGLTGAPIRGK